MNSVFEYKKSHFKMEIIKKLRAIYLVIDHNSTNFFFFYKNMIFIANIIMS